MLSVLLMRWQCAILTALFLVFPSLSPAAEVSVLDLPEAQARALNFSPDLAAASLGLQAASARRQQAGRRPNPGLEMEWENFGGSGDLSGIESSEWTLSVSQVFDLGGKRGLAMEQISQEMSLLAWERKTALLDLRREVGLAFAEVWFAQESTLLIHHQVELAEMLKAELAARLRAGGSSAIEVTRARVDVATAEVSLVHAEENQQTALRNLTSLWGGQVPDFQEVILPPDFWKQAAVFPTEVTVAGNPDIVRWNAVESLQDSRLKVAESASAIDLELALGIKWENMTGDRAFVFGAGIPLPTSDRNQGEILALGYEIQKTEKLQQATENRLETRLAEAVGSQVSARREMEIMSVEILPLAQQAYEETKLGHQRGLYSLTDVFATRNDLFALRRTQLESQLSFFRATVMIARLTGKSIQELAPVLMEDK